MAGDAETAPFSCRCLAGGFHNMADLIGTGRYPLGKVASGFCQSDAPRLTLEQEDAKASLQRLHERADAGLRRAERLGSMAEIQVLGDGQHLHQCRHWNAAAV